MIKRTEPGTAAITSRQSKYFRAIFRPFDANLCMLHQCLNLVTVNQPANEYHRQEYQYKNPETISVEIIFVHLLRSWAIVQQINDP